MATPSYAAWPTISDVQDRLDMAGITLRTSSRVSAPTYRQRVLDAVTAEVTKRTHRTFVPVTETRYFDGSGTGVQEVDEIVTLTSVAVMGWVSGSPLTLDNVYLRQDKTYPHTLIEITQGILPAAVLYFDAFPAGRQNIKVVGSWGYAATIPADLWESVAEETAARLAAESVFDPDGRLESWREADGTTEKYVLQLVGEAAEWHPRFVDRVKDYTRAVDRNLRAWKPRMI